MSRLAIIGMVVLASLNVLPLAHAQEDTIRVTPDLVDAAEPVTRGLQTNKSHFTTKLQGKGGQSLRIHYGSTDTLDIYLVPLQADQQYSPTDFLHFTLPAAGEGQALVDLTPSPGWSPNITSYLATILVKDETVQAGFSTIEFIPATPLTIVTTAVKHFFIPESYAPNSYHALRGYRALGWQVTMAFGVLAMLVAAVALVRRRSADGIQVAIGILVCGCLLYGARFALDLTQFTAQHLSEYYGHGMYDEAGSMQEIAGVITMSGPAEPKSVYICRDGTNFREKLLRYFVYPIPVSDSPAMASGSTLVLMDGKIDWSFNDGMLLCGDAQTNAELLSTFHDGSQLFRRTAK